MQNDSKRSKSELKGKFESVKDSLTMSVGEYNTSKDENIIMCIIFYRIFGPSWLCGVGGFFVFSQ